MKELIKEKYQKLYTESAEFRIHADNINKLSCEEIEAQFGLDNDVISYFLATLKN